MGIYDDLFAGKQEPSKSGGRRTFNGVLVPKEVDALAKHPMIGKLMGKVNDREIACIGLGITMFQIRFLEEIKKISDEDNGEEIPHRKLQKIFLDLKKEFGMGS